MSMFASNVGTIPADGFSWYVLFLEDRFDDPLKAQLSENFQTLGREVGPDVLVVRGYDAGDFFRSAYETLTLYDPEWRDRLKPPAILVSDTAPRLLMSEPAKLRAAKLIYFSLDHLRDKPGGAVTDWLRKLVGALHDPEAGKALESLEPGALARIWGWLRGFVEFKPSFMGFGVNVNALIDKAVPPA